jgi:hypothetical protein
MQSQGGFKVTAKRKPKIVYDYTVLQKVLYLVDKWDLECQWYHTVKKTETKSEVIFTITDIFIPEQECEGAEISSNGMDLANMYRSLKAERNLTTPELGELIKTINVWCHSHVNMQCKASPTDEKQWAEQIKLSARAQDPQPQVMLIFNKRQEYFVRVYDTVTGIEYTNPQISVNHGIDFSTIDDIIANKLKIVKKPEPKKPSPSIPTGFHHHNIQSNIVYPKTRPPQYQGIHSTPPKTSKSLYRDSKHFGKDTSGAEGATSPQKESWKNVLLKDKFASLDKSTIEAILRIVRKLNATAKIAASEIIIQNLLEILDTELSWGSISWEIFYTLLLSDDDTEIENIIDLALAPGENNSQKARQGFITFVEQMTIDPPELLIQALQMAVWYEQSTYVKDPTDRTDLVEGLNNLWLDMHFTNTRTQDTEQLMREINNGFGS